MSASEPIYDFIESMWYPIDLDMRETLYRVCLKYKPPEMNEASLKGNICKMSNGLVLNLYKEFSNNKITEDKVISYCNSSATVSLSPSTNYVSYKDIMNAILPRKITLIDLVQAAPAAAPAAAASATSSGGSTSESYKNMLIDKIVEWLNNNYTSIPSYYIQYLNYKTIDELINIISRINDGMFDIAEIANPSY